MLFESHAHYDDKRFDSDRDHLLMSLKDSSIGYVVNAGADLESSRIGINLARDYDFIYAAVGVHPHEADSLTDEGFAMLNELSRQQKVVAIGEMGLDFYYDNSKRESQRFWFKRQLEMAESLNFPVIIHSRDAASETFDIIKASGVRSGVIHCFSGSLELALEYIKLGFYIGIGGVITFPKARVSVEVVTGVPLSKILIETDCPYLAPVPNRGKRNDSTNLVHIANKIAEIKNITPDEVAEITTRNALECFTMLH